MEDYFEVANKWVVHIERLGKSMTLVNDDPKDPSSTYHRKTVVDFRIL